ncbi:MAG: hypothetical protein GY931_05970 [Maribacter sp.]|nr:hypothetical protein [Maribacter sp.]
MRKIFEKYGVSEEKASIDMDIENPNIKESLIALLRVDVKDQSSALKNMHTVVGVLNQNGYDIESFFSNFIFVPIHSDISTFEKLLEPLLKQNIISVLVSNITGHIGSFGSNKRQTFGHLSSETEVLLSSLLSLGLGEIEIRA